ncbi:MAG TPA: SRPBCC family protein [Prosthecobacter sp.]
MNESNNSYGDLSIAGEVRFVRLLPGPLERVWAFLTDPEKRGLWLAHGETELRAGGKVRLEFHHSQLTEAKEEIPEKYRESCQDGCSFTGTVLQCEPPRLLSHTWGEPDGSASEVTFELSSEDDGRVRLVITHRKLGTSRDELLSVSSGWHAHAAILVAKLEGAEPPPFWSTHARLEEDYEEKLAPAAS